MTMTDSVYVPKNPLGELIIKLGFLDLLVWARCKQKMDRASFTYAFKPSFWWGCYSLSPENTFAKLVFFEGWTRRQGQLYPETKPIILNKANPGGAYVALLISTARELYNLIYMYLRY